MDMPISRFVLYEKQAERICEQIEAAQQKPPGE